MNSRTTLKVLIYSYIFFSLFGSEIFYRLFLKCNPYCAFSCDPPDYEIVEIFGKVGYTDKGEIYFQFFSERRKPPYFLNVFVKDMETGKDIWERYYYLTGEDGIIYYGSPITGLKEDCKSILMRESIYEIPCPGPGKKLAHGKKYKLFAGTVIGYDYYGRYNFKPLEFIYFSPK